MRDSTGDEMLATNSQPDETKSMNEWLFLFGFFILWLALQLWILPKMGIGT